MAAVSAQPLDLDALAILLFQQHSARPNVAQRVQEDDVCRLPHDLRRRSFEDALGRRVERLDGAAAVKRDDAVRDIAHDRARAGFAALQLGVGFDELQRALLDRALDECLAAEA
jgi:hypothetical protein